MIYITGDIHGNPYTRFARDIFTEQTGMNKSDCVIVCGDFGCIWDYKCESIKEKSKLDWLNDKNFTTLFVDGNHECFDRLNEYPVKEWNGGLVHEIRPAVLHLMRGQLFNIDGCKIFTFGGARSHDIRDGVLDQGDSRICEWNRDPFKLFRINKISWWEQEMPTPDEMETGRKNLAENDWKVDYIITHDCAASTKALLGYRSKPDELNKYLEEIRQKCDYKKWFFGHYHDNKQINAEEILLYEQIVRIW